MHLQEPFKVVLAFLYSGTLPPELLASGPRLPLTESLRPIPTKVHSLATATPVPAWSILAPQMPAQAEYLSTLPTRVDSHLQPGHFPLTPTGCQAGRPQACCRRVLSSRC